MRNFLAVLLLLGVLIPSPILSLSPSEETKYGKQIHNEILRSSRLNPDYAVAFYVEDLKRGLESLFGLSHPVKITVIDSSSIDAFATIGGYIYLTTSLIATCENEDELSSVIAHELAHVSKRHVVKRIEKEKLLNVGRIATLVIAMLSGNPRVQEAIVFSGIGAFQAASLYYSREDEKEADILAASILEKAGMSCRAISDFLRRLRVSGKDKDLPQYLLTHPYHEERIALLSSICKDERKKDGSLSLFDYVLERARILTHKNREELLTYHQKNYERAKDQKSAMALAYLYASLEKKDEALRWTSKIDEPMRRLIEGEVSFLTKDYNRAISYLEKIDLSLAKFILGRSYEELGDLERAKGYYEEIRDYGDSFPEIYYRLSMVYGRTKDKAKGFEYLGRFHLSYGREYEARNFLNRAISLYGKDSKEAEEIRRILRSLERS